MTSFSAGHIILTPTQPVSWYDISWREGIYIMSQHLLYFCTYIYLEEEGLSRRWNQYSNKQTYLGLYVDLASLCPFCLSPSGSLCLSVSPVCGTLYTHSDIIKIFAKMWYLYPVSTVSKFKFLFWNLTLGTFMSIFKTKRGQFRILLLSNRERVSTMKL